MAGRIRSTERPGLLGLVGGFASRLYPLTAFKDTTAKQLAGVGLAPQSYNPNAFLKPLSPLAGTPLMLPLFRRTVSDCGVQEVGLALMKTPEDIRDFFGPDMAPLRSGTGGSYYWQHQSESVNLNTAGCIVKGWLQDFAGRRGRPETFIVLSADIRSGANIGKMMAMHKKKNALLSIALAPVPWKDVERFGVVFLAGSSTDKKDRQITGSAGGYAKIVRFEEKKKDAKSNLNNASIYMVSERLLELISDDQVVAANRNQLQPDLKQRYIVLKDKMRGKKLTDAEKRELDKINPYNLPIPGVDGVPDRPFEAERGNYLNDWTDPNTGKHYRLGIFSTSLIRRGLMPEDQANKSYQDWGGHIFPEVATHHPEIYKAKNPGDATGFYGYVTRSLWADDGTRSAILQANMEFLMQEGGMSTGANKYDFSWWPKPPRVEHDSAGRPIWLGKNVTIEEGARIIGPAYLGDGVFVKRGSVIAQSVIGAGWRIEEGEVSGSAIWPSRAAMGLPVLDPNLEYTLRGMSLKDCLVGSGFHRNGLPNVLCLDLNGSYGVQISSGRQGLVNLQGQVVVSNEHATIATRIDQTKAAATAGVQTPEIKQLSARTIWAAAVSEIKAQRHILVVDDEADDRLITVETLRKAGWQNIDTASTPEEARKMLREKRYDFMIFDCILRPQIPVESLEQTDGVAILREQKLDPALPNYGTQILMWSSFESLKALKGLPPSVALNIGGQQGVIWKPKEDPELQAAGLSEYIVKAMLSKRF